MKHQALIDLESLTKQIIHSLNRGAKHANLEQTYYTEWKKGDKVIEFQNKSTKNYYTFNFYMKLYTTVLVDKKDTIGEGEHARTKIIKVKEKKEEIVPLYAGHYPVTIKDALNTNKLLERAHKEFYLQGISALASMNQGFYEHGKERVDDIKKTIAEKKEEETKKKTNLSR